MRSISRGDKGVCNRKWVLVRSRIKLIDAVPPGAFFVQHVPPRRISSSVPGSSPRQTNHDPAGNGGLGARRACARSSAQDRCDHLGHARVE